jgi:hypothetical protein
LNFSYYYTSVIYVNFYVQVKAAFTRTYNKTARPKPYATGVMSKKGKKRQAGDGDDLEGLDEELGGNGEEGAGNGSGASDEEDITQDSMIKVRYFMMWQVACKW